MVAWHDRLRYLEANMNVRVFGAVFVLAAMFSACGGTSSSDGSGGAGAQAGSGANASGGAGAGAGSGGTGATSGGSGGAVGGNGGAGGSALTKIEQFCAQLDKLPCVGDGCIQEINAIAAEAANSGCTAEFEAVLDCSLANPFQCVDGLPQSPAVCKAAENTYDDCVSPSSCAVGVGSGQCSLSCNGYGAKCLESSGSSLSCSCTDGPHAGTSFLVPGTCGGNWRDEADKKCAP